MGGDDEANGGDVGDGGAPLESLEDLDSFMDEILASFPGAKSLPEAVAAAEPEPAAPKPKPAPVAAKSKPAPVAAKPKPLTASNPKPKPAVAAKPKPAMAAKPKSSSAAKNKVAASSLFDDDSDSDDLLGC